MSKPEEEKTFFVSRRGHQVGINQVDLSGIDIEGEHDSPKLSKRDTRSAKTPVESIKSDKSAKKPRSRTKIIIFSLVIALFALPVIAGEIVGAQYRSGAVNAKKQLTTLVTDTVLPLQKKSAVSADQIRTVADDVNEIVGNMCRGGMLDNMASLYPRAKANLDSCKSAQTTYAALTSSLYNLEAQTRYLEKIGALMKTVATPITDEYAVIGAQQAAWQTASEGLKDVSPPTAMNGVHQELGTHVLAVADHWSKLNTANNAQDAAAFTQAEKDLASEYEAVRTAGSMYTSVLAATQQRLTASYSALK